MGELNSILLIKMSAVGDVIMALPALEALRRRYPRARIDWLVEAPSLSLLEGHKAIDRLIVWPRRPLSSLVKGGRLLKAASLGRKYLRELREVEYDVALDLQGLFKSGIQIFFSRARRRLGFARCRERVEIFYNETMPAYDPQRHALLRYLDAAAFLGAERPEAVPRRYYWPPAQAVAGAEALLAHLGSEFVVLNPGAKWDTKRWPQSHWESLARLLAAAGHSLLITGGPEDGPAAEAIARAAGPASLNLCGRTSLAELAEILARAQAVITADTGPMHLAAAVGGRGLALFGPTRPERTGPLGGYFEILRPELDCLGCLKKVCPRSCLAEIKPETVAERLRTLLAAGEAGDDGP